MNDEIKILLGLLLREMSLNNRDIGHLKNSKFNNNDWWISDAFGDVYILKEYKQPFTGQITYVPYMGINKDGDVYEVIDSKDFFTKEDVISANKSGRPLQVSYNTEYRILNSYFKDENDEISMTEDEMNVYKADAHKFMDIMSTDDTYMDDHIFIEQFLGRNSNVVRHPSIAGKRNASKQLYKEVEEEFIADNIAKYGDTPQWKGLTPKQQRQGASPRTTEELAKYADEKYGGNNNSLDGQKEKQIQGSNNSTPETKQQAQQQGAQSKAQAAAVQTPNPGTPNQNPHTKSPVQPAQPAQPAKPSTSIGAGTAKAGMPPIKPIPNATPGSIPVPNTVSPEPNAQTPQQPPQNQQASPSLQPNQGQTTNPLNTPQTQTPQSTQQGQPVVITPEQVVSTDGTVTTQAPVTQQAPYKTYGPRISQGYDSGRVEVRPNYLYQHQPNDYGILPSIRGRNKSVESSTVEQDPNRPPNAIVYGINRGLNALNKGANRIVMTNEDFERYYGEPRRRERTPRVSPYEGMTSEQIVEANRGRGQRRALKAAVDNEMQQMRGESDEAFKKRRETVERWRQKRINKNLNRYNDAKMYEENDLHGRDVNRAEGTFRYNNSVNRHQSDIAATRAENKEELMMLNRDNDVNLIRNQGEYQRDAEGRIIDARNKRIKRDTKKGTYNHEIEAQRKENDRKMRWVHENSPRGTTSQNERDAVGGLIQYEYYNSDRPEVTTPKVITPDRIIAEKQPIDRSQLDELDKQALLEQQQYSELDAKYNLEGREPQVFRRGGIPKFQYSGYTPGSNVLGGKDLAKSLVDESNKRLSLDIDRAEFGKTPYQQKDIKINTDGLMSTDKIVGTDGYVLGSDGYTKPGYYKLDALYIAPQTKTTKTVPGVSGYEYDPTRLSKYHHKMNYYANTIPFAHNASKYLFDKPLVERSRYNKQDEATLSGLRNNLVRPNMENINAQASATMDMIRQNSRNTGTMMANLQAANTNTANARNQVAGQALATNVAQRNNYLNVLHGVGAARKAEDDQVFNRNLQHEVTHDKFGKEARESAEKALINKSKMLGQEWEDELNIRNYLNNLTQDYTYGRDAHGNPVVIHTPKDGNIPLNMKQGIGHNMKEQTLTHSTYDVLSDPSKNDADKIAYLTALKTVNPNLYKMMKEGKTPGNEWSKYKALFDAADKTGTAPKTNKMGGFVTTKRNYLFN